MQNIRINVFLLQLDFIFQTVHERIWPLWNDLFVFHWVDNSAFLQPKQYFYEGLCRRAEWSSQDLCWCLSHLSLCCFSKLFNWADVRIFLPSFYTRGWASDNRISERLQCLFYWSHTFHMNVKSFVSFNFNGLGKYLRAH